MPLTEDTCYALLRSHYDEYLERKRRKLETLEGAKLLEKREKQRKREEKADFHLAHTERVVSICREILSGLSPESRGRVDEELLIAAAILHDVAKFDEKKGEHDHHKLAAGVLSANRAALGPDVDGGTLGALADIIRAHKGKKFQPGEGHAREAAILRMADKVDMLRQGKDKADKYSEGLRLIGAYFARYPKDSPEARFSGDLQAVLSALPKGPELPGSPKT